MTILGVQNCRHVDIANPKCHTAPIMRKHDVIHKPEVHNVFHCSQRIEPRPQITRTENFEKFGRVVFAIYEQTERHTVTVPGAIPLVEPTVN